MCFKLCFILQIFLLFVLKTNAIRPLLYPNNGGSLKVVLGFGVPVDDLVLETINAGMVWRFHFRLPSRIEQLKHRTVTKLGRNMDNLENVQGGIDQQSERNVTVGEINGLELNKNVISSIRWGVYQSLEGLAIRMGLNGRSCVLKSVCEVAEDPFHFGNGMWAELMHILLTPSSSVDKLSEHSDNQYYQAEHLGRSGADCHRVFGSCSRSLLEHFSNFYELTDELRQSL